MASFWFRTVCVAAGYFLAGQLGLLLAIPPAFSSAVWPASGVALAAVLLWGPRVLFGVACGSFFVELTVWASSPHAHGSLLVGCAVALPLAIGVSIQAAVGAWLIRRTVGFPTPLDEAKDIALFLALGGPVACLISSTLAVVVLTASGWIGTDSSLAAAVRWWVGDSIGVLTVTPLLLVAFAKPREVWRTRVFSVAVPLALTNVVAFVAFLGASRYEEERIRSDFNEFAQQQFDAIREQLEVASQAVQGVASYMTVAEPVTSRSFGQFVAHTLASYPSLRSLCWVPKVPYEQRKEFEDTANFKIMELAQPDNGRKLASVRREYFPVYFRESTIGNTNVIGLDLASEATRWQAMARARDTGEASFSGLVHLAQDSEEGVLATAPVYDAGPTPASEEERRRRLRGFAVGAIRVSRLIDAATRWSGRASLTIDVVDVTPGTGGGVLFSDKRPTERARLNLEAVRVMDVGNRRWRLHGAVTSAYLAGFSTWHTWAVFATGLVFSGLLGALLLIVTGRTVSTERIVARRTSEIEERERKFRDLLDATPDAVLILKQAGEILLINAQAKAWFGYSSEELVGRDVEILAPERLREQFRYHHRSYLENSAARTRSGFEFMIKRKDGSEFPAEITLNPIETRHDLLVAVAIRDVSSRKRLEEEVRQSQKMEAIGTLASGVAHDFNNLLMGVSGCTSIALSLLGNESPARVYLNEIKLSCESGAAITRQLLAFSRKKDVQPRAVDLNDVVSSSTNMLKRLLGENIELAVRLDAVGARTVMDPSQLEQVLMNLVINAHDAMPWGGRLSIDTGVVLLRDGNGKGLPGGAYVALTVADTGHGMTDETRQRIFEPFFTTKPVGKGTGLGLSTVHALITQAGGHISVQSRPGEGAMFRALLPAAIDTPELISLPS